MARLRAEHKIFIIQRLACFDSPSVVAKAVRDEFGIEITRQSIEGYDPTKRAGSSMPSKLKAVFEETRKSFLEDTSGIAISHKAVRLRALQRMAERAEEVGNIVAAMDLLEQAAKEVGDAYSNRRVLAHEGKDGGPIQQQTVPLTQEQLKEELERRGLPTAIFD